MRYYFIGQNYQKVKERYDVSTNLNAEELSMLLSAHKINKEIEVSVRYNGSLPDYNEVGLLLVVSDKVKSEIKSEEIGFIPVKVFQTMKKKLIEHSDFYLLLVPTKSALDLEKSDLTWLKPNVFISEIRKAVIDETSFGFSSIVRIKERQSLYLADELTYERLKKIDDIEFISSEKFQSIF